MVEKEAPETAGDAQPQYLRRGEDFESLYANSVYFQPSEWDLKLTFGEVDNDLKDNRVFIEQHTSIAVPWLQAKLMSYYLGLQVAAYEMEHGPIKVPPTLIPPEPGPAPEPSMQRLYEYIAKVRQEFFEPQKSTAQ